MGTNLAISLKSILSPIDLCSLQGSSCRLSLIPSQITFSFDGVLHYVKNQVKQAWKKLNQIKRNAFPHRVDFLRQRIKKNTNEHKPVQAKKIRQMLDKEIRQATYKKLSRLTKGPHDSGLSKVLRPDDNNDTITDEITDPEELFDCLIKRNKQHFSQANETYLAKPPHSEILPPFHYSPAVNKVLEGNLNSFNSLQPELKALLTEMKALAPQNTINPIMTITNFRDGMKKVPEGKSSSLSGRNYSIYKAMLPDDY
jgi:hypothetical protein